MSYFGWLQSGYSGWLGTTPHHHIDEVLDARVHAPVAGDYVNLELGKRQQRTSVTFFYYALKRF
jgi:hypothetical protein